MGHSHWWLLDDDLDDPDNDPLWPEWMSILVFVLSTTFFAILLVFNLIRLWRVLVHG